MSEEKDNENLEDQVSPLDMSDDEAAELLLSDDETPVITEPEPKEEENSSEETATDDQEEETEDSTEETEETSETEKEPEPDLAANADKDPEDTDTAEKKDGKEFKEGKDSTEQKADSKDKEPEVSIDYKTEYERLLAPFKANGKNMKITSVDDALTLMKMGANYNKKMAGLKPNLRMLKLLEKNDLLDESKLGYLIDLSNKNPEVIKKLVKDSGVDPLDIDTEKESEYSPTTYTVDDKEVELDGVLDEIRDTNSFKDTLSIISNKWDDSSKQVLYESPHLIKIINEHVDTGVYGKIDSIIEQQRMLGKLEGMSDIQAYKYVGDAIMANGGFNTSDRATEEKLDATGGEIIKPAPKREDPKLKDRKRAASSTKSTGTKSPDFSPLAMSDEDFEKVSGSQFL